MWLLTCRGGEKCIQVNLECNICAHVKSSMFCAMLTVEQEEMEESLCASAVVLAIYNQQGALGLCLLNVYFYS